MCSAPRNPEQSLPNLKVIMCALEDVTARPRFDLDTTAGKTEYVITYAGKTAARLARVRAALGRQDDHAIIHCGNVMELRVVHSYKHLGPGDHRNRNSGDTCRPGCGVPETWVSPKALSSMLNVVRLSREPRPRVQVEKLTHLHMCRVSRCRKGATVAVSSTDSAPELPAAEPPFSSRRRTPESAVGTCASISAGRLS